MKTALNLVDTILSRIEFVVIAVLSVAALVLGTAQVVMRYAFNTGYTWSEAVFVLMTVAAMLFAGSRAVREDGHVRVDILPLLMPQRVQTVLRILRYVVSLSLCAFFAYAGLQYVVFTKSMGIVSPASNLPVWMTFLIVPVTMGFFCARYVILLLREAGGEETGRPEHSEAARVAAAQEPGE
ncbi:TRAP transporter small permease [Lutibaculum baratangense]|uniref:TRAP transporter small permease protein n=1 Tax=Lutibaculum baratangense AMV1 TaxID=631454 RepID=V4RC40_9HYPH|nr:TRAP transporter small permease [Lutibaculum baratangense]ESR23736.1 hypothetical protein N177_2966 [Lutibaculum baratangense AMV1]